MKSAGAAYASSYRSQPEAEAQPETKHEAEAAAEPTPQPEPEAEAEGEVEPESKPEAEATPEAEPTPEVAAKPQTATEAEDQPEATTPTTPEADPTTEANAEPTAQAQAEAEAQPETKPEAEATPEPETEAVAEVAAEAVATESAAPVDSTPAPAPTNGEDTPQGPPAPDNESRAGGHDIPVPPTLRTAYTAAATTLKAHNIPTATTTPTKIYLVLDRSASMRPYYKDGSAQALGEQTLALAAHLDPEATVHVTFFSTELDGTGELTLPDHENKIDTLHASLGRMGRTSYHVAVEDVLTHHDKTTTPTTRALVIFQTDGAPDAKTPATQALTSAAKSHPHIHFAFVAFGEHDNKAFDYLRKLKTGNTSFFHAGPTPKELTDTEFYEGVLANWRP
ncbi:VWA domain-containing protein [Streptomyces sp. N502]|uniref:VWA domain-containing protein n=1 Tax=Streptomyces sp. N502 TaxID=2730916 RepID=UPI003211E713